MEQIIELPVTSLDYQEIIDDGDHKVIMRIKLGQKSLSYLVMFSAMEPIDAEDLKRGSQKKKTYINVFALKKDVSAVELVLTEGPETGNEFWKIVISVNGKQNDIWAYFDNQQEAVTVFKQIKAWMETN